MKKMVFFFCLLGGVSLCRGQNNIDKTIALKDSTIEYNVTLNVKKGIKEINCYVQAFLSTGDLSLLFSDPEGKKEAGFGLSTESDKTPGNGRMTHSIKIPYPGTWTLHIKAANATGNLIYKIHIK